MVEEIDGVVNETPDPSDAPPVEAAYQEIGSADEAVRMTVPVPQRCAEVVVGTAGTVPIVAVTATRVLGHVPPACA